jgi:hypothetical protein
MPRGTQVANRNWKNLFAQGKLCLLWFGIIDAEQTMVLHAMKDISLKMR